MGKFSENHSLYSFKYILGLYCHFLLKHKIIKEMLMEKYKNNNLQYLMNFHQYFFSRVILLFFTLGCLLLRSENEGGNSENK